MFKINNTTRVEDIFKVYTNPNTEKPFYQSFSTNKNIQKNWQDHLMCIKRNNYKSIDQINLEIKGIKIRSNEKYI